MCGENEKCVDKALSCIQDLIKNEQSLYTIEDECIKYFDEKECQELSKLHNNLNISISWDAERPSSIKVTGISKDVEQAEKAIEKMIRTVRAAREQESRADYVSEFVEWQYNDNNTFHNFDKMTNLQLEDAKKAKKNTVNVKINNQSYTVDLKSFAATDAKGHSLPVRRLPKSEGESNLNACYPLFYTSFGLNTLVHTSKLYSNR